MDKQAWLFGILLVGVVFQMNVEVRAAQDLNSSGTNEDFDVYDYPHEDDNWSYGIVDSCRNMSSRGPLGGIHDWQWKSDGELKDTVKCHIESNPFIKTRKGIDVSIDDGTATLSGTVQDKDSIRSAIVDAYGAGVREVVSKLEVAEEE